MADLDDGSYYGGYSNDVNEAVDKRKVVIEDELVAQTDLVRQILKQRTERESLLDIRGFNVGRHGRRWRRR